MRIIILQNLNVLSHVQQGLGGPILMAFSANLVRLIRNEVKKLNPESKMNGKLIAVLASIFGLCFILIGMTLTFVNHGQLYSVWIQLFIGGHVLSIGLPTMWIRSHSGMRNFFLKSILRSNSPYEIDV